VCLFIYICLGHMRSGLGLHFAQPRPHVWVKVVYCGSYDALIVSDFSVIFKLNTQWRKELIGFYQILFQV
jgi:hypothetical protein